MTTTAYSPRHETGRRVFSRVLVGIDGSPASLEAARQAALLEAPDGQLTLLVSWGAFPPLLTVAKVPESSSDVELQRTFAAKALAEAREYVAPYSAAVGKVARGVAAVELLEEIEATEQTLVAVGGKAHARVAGMLAGQVATELIHRSPCSVLVARQASDGFPRHIVVGVDGSVGSAAAYAVGRHLAERYDAELRAIVAQGAHLDERHIDPITHGRHEESPERPVEALAAAGADLLIVGSRGLHGVRALGSVSERLAHAAPCSVLIVREPVWERIAVAVG